MVKRTPYMGRKAVTNREQYSQSVIVPTDAMGHYGAKPWPFNYYRAVEQCSGWVYRCVMGNASAAAAVPLRLYIRKRSKLELKAAGLGEPVFESRPVPMRRRKYIRGEFYDHQPSAAVRHKLASFGDDFEEVHDHPVLDLLRTVNPMFNGFDLAMFRFTMLQLTGNAYLHPVMSSSLMRPAELWPMPSHWTRVVPGQAGGEEFIERYVFGDGYTREHRFEPDEVLHFATNRGVRDLWYGYGPMEAAWSTLGLSVSKRISDKALFDNMSRPDYVLSIEGASPEEAQRTESRISAMHRGVRRVGKALVTTGRARVQTLQFPPKDTGEFAEILEELAGIFGYPIQKLKAAYEPKANAETADYSWMKDTILPMLRHDEESLNQGGYLGLFGGGALLEDAVLAYDDPVPANAETERNNTQVYISTGIWTINDRRAEMGLPPVEGGDVPRFNGVSIEALDKQAEAAAQAASQPFGSIVGPGGSPVLPSSPAAQEQQQEAPKPNVSLNGAQIQAAQGIVSDVAANKIPKGAAIELLAAVGVPRAIAQTMIEEAESFVPQSDDQPAEPAKAASLAIAKDLPYPMTRTKAATPPKDHPALTADLTGTYDADDDALPWIGWMEPGDAAWIGFLSEDGWLVVFDERDEEGAVMGKPWAIRRDDLIDGDTEPEPGRKAPAKYDDIDFKPTRSMAEAAQQGLDYRSKYGRGGTEVGIARARDIAGRRNLSPDTVARMASFFARHEGNRDPDAEESDGGPSNGWIAWLLWGGDPGRAWADKVVAQMERADDEGPDDDKRSKDRSCKNITPAKAVPDDPKNTVDQSTAAGDSAGCTKPGCTCKTYTPDKPEGDVAEAIKQYGPDAEFMPIGFKGYPNLKSNADGEATGEADDTVREGEDETPIQRMARAMADAFKQQEQAVLAALKAQGFKSPRTKADKPDIEAARNDPRVVRVLESLDSAPLFEAAQQTLPPMIEAGAQSGAQQVGIDLAFDVSNPLVERAARSRAMQLAGDLNQTTIDRLRESLADGIASGESSAKLAARVREQFDSFADDRAITIARTESAMAYEDGQVAAWEESDVVESKQWLIAGGACEFCEAIDQQYKDKAIGLNAQFAPKGATIRGTRGGTMKVNYRDLASPPAHPRCRCDLIPVLGGEFKALKEALIKNDRQAITKFWTARRAESPAADREAEDRDQPGADGPAGVSG